MRRIFLTALAMVSWSGSVWGQASAPPGNQAELVKTLLERIDKLEKRVSDLEGKLACPSPPCEPTVRAARALEVGVAAKPVAAVQNPAPMPEHEQRPPLAGEQSTFPSMQIRGFADVDFSATNQHGVPSNSGFNLGEFVLHLASPLSRKITVFGEIAFDPQPEGFTVDVERAFIRYDLDDSFKISFGRYHTPISYWNTAFHHGTWLQTTISRPEMIAFHGPLLPSHFVGVEAEGSIPSGGAGLGYAVGLGNGRSLFLHEPGQVGDSDNNRALILNLFARPRKLDGLQIGGAFYHDKLSFQPEMGSTAGTPAPVPNFYEWIASGHVVWTKRAPEFLAEYSNIHHRPVLGGPAFDSRMFYVQGAYRLPFQEQKWKPYYRFEYTNLPMGDPFLAEAPHDLRLSILGLRYDITTFAAFKAEYRNRQQQIGDPHVNGVFLQTSFTF